MKHLIIIPLLVLPFAFAVNATEADQIGESRDVERVAEVFNRLNPVLAKDHLAPLTFTQSDLLVFHPEDINRKIKVWEFKTSNIFLRFLPDNFELLSLERNIDFTPGIGYDRPLGPNWTEEKAIATAKNYAEAIFGGFPKNVGSPSAKFEPCEDRPQNSSVMKYYPGIWHIRWPRVDGGGHLFDIDSVNVSISEKQGLVAAAVNFFSIYKEPQGPLISQDEALKIADPAAGSLVSKWLGAGLQLGSHRIVEGIVNPDYILQAKSIEDIAQRDTIARLAWVIRYDLTVNGALSSEHDVQVWVDAQSKEVIGGDFR